MKYRIEREVLELCPGYVRGVVIADGLRNGEKENPEILAMLREAETRVRTCPSLEDIAAHPRIAAWRTVYGKFGARPSKFFSSIEAMIRRLRKGGELPYINDLAAIGNVFSLRHLVPVGGHDIGAIRHDLRLARASGHETFTPFGTNDLEHPEPGEVVYLDGDIVLCRRWTWRQAEFTKLTPQSTYVVINVDGLPPVDFAEVQAISEALALAVTRFCGGRALCRYLSAETPEIDLVI